MYYSTSIIMLVASCSILQPLTQAHDKPGLYLQGKDDLGLLDRQRSKRAVYTIGAAVLKGMKAAAELLKGTKRIQPNSKYERSRVRAFKVQYYEKPGTYTTAMKDFFSVDPTDIKEYEIPHKYKGLLGTVGDRSISVRDKGIIDDKPLMIIVRTLPSGQQRIDKITYTN